MHVIFGGAFNGKRTYVEKMLQERHQQSVEWLDATVNTPVLSPKTETIVVYGVENVPEEGLNMLLKQIEQWEEKVEIIVIATEIGRGIVPMEAGMRKLRDDVGRFYQQLFTKAERVTRIWYGISQTIKGDV
ncbi:bifunctional adenosylcobinamide kinase/adenosylcobinamide-phosphate guanylyltransferase [Psychrobacillus vulpis]|uniref:Uncharacterized protein n=1 Tax=Psychrobacillus vulpis TaxID=2325572 RepID=A0A544TUJ6_9BACI|nr:bifunctional adenosylcobinamide kinase/adenosylcobinamide-phosphate guanylyltransferase [Psychrobacillus vulpis]TQR21134.1 hypothetical protein FG384_02710 [Psychrobacillus vulpis]